MDPLDQMLDRHPTLSVCHDDVMAAFAILRDSFAAGGKLLVGGNGGSAADADHIAGELIKGFRRARPLSAEQRVGLPAHLADQLQCGLPVLPLGSFRAFTSAFANDVRGELGLAQEAHVFGRPGDVLLAISTSGESCNLVNALTVARSRTLHTIGLTGAGGGTIATLCDSCIRVPTRATDAVQELHLPVYHCLCAMLEDHFFCQENAFRRPGNVGIR